MIYLNEDIRIDADNHQYILQRRQGKKWQEKNTYHKTLKQVSDRLVEEGYRKLFNKELQTLEDIHINSLSLSEKLLKELQGVSNEIQSRYSIHSPESREENE